MGGSRHRAILGREPIRRVPSVTLLETIHDPAQLRALDYAELERLATELREKMIRTVQHTGGDPARSPGAVEIALAPPRGVDSPPDPMGWGTRAPGYPPQPLTRRPG